MTPEAWSQNDERQYVAIKQSLITEDHSVEKAKEIAARTVNKRRRKEGRTPSKRTQGTGNPNTVLEKRTLPELQNLAADLHIDGRSKLRKAELIGAIRSRRGQ